MTAGYLLDTNILLYVSNPGTPEHAAAKEALTRLLARGERLDMDHKSLSAVPSRRANEIFRVPETGDVSKPN